MDASRLRGVGLFDGLTEAEIARCAAWFEDKQVPAGTRLVSEGDFSYRFFVVLDGDIEVRHDLDEVRRLGPGDYFGELGLLTGDRRSAKIVALSRSDVATIMTWDFRTMVAEHPLVAERLRAAAARHRRHDAGS
jgi:CRP-like cAMP-binding protein